MRSYKWDEGAVAALDGQKPFARTHKRLATGLVTLTLDPVPDFGLGVDLELRSERPMFRGPRTEILRKLQLPESVTDAEIIEEWSVREAAYKALSRHGQSGLDPDWRDMVRRSPLVMEWRPKLGHLVELETRSEWQGLLLLTLARTRIGSDS